MQYTEIHSILDFCFFFSTPYEKEIYLKLLREKKHLCLKYYTFYCIHPFFWGKRIKSRSKSYCGQCQPKCPWSWCMRNFNTALQLHLSLHHFSHKNSHCCSCSVDISPQRTPISWYLHVALTTENVYTFDVLFIYDTLLTRAAGEYHNKTPAIYTERKQRTCHHVDQLPPPNSCS